MAQISDYNALGQSIWYDYLRRSAIKSGELKQLIDKGLSGVTANPSIFEKAIVGSTDYDDEIKKLVEQNKSIPEILEALMIDDISMTADLFRPMYDSLDGRDGFVSIEVSPRLANDARGMVQEGRRFFSEVHRPNVMIKIPATQAGMTSIRDLISEGINVNVTLIFSQKQYEQAAEAYISGLEALDAKKGGGNLNHVNSVASFFVSRVDTAVDKALAKLGNTELEGKIAIANAKVAYQRFKEIFSGERWERLRRKGARVQRVLWASTSTKNPLYPDTMYLDNLIGPDTINTVPPQTLKAAFDHGHVALTLNSGLDEAKRNLERLAQVGVKLEDITNQLEDEGIEAFTKSTEKLEAALREKQEKLKTQSWRESAKLGAYEPIVDLALAKIAEDGIIHRIWSLDYTVWKPNPTEISNRLGWLHIAEKMEENVQRLDDLAEIIHDAGYTSGVLVGMGGSSLAPELFIKSFGGVKDGEKQQQRQYPPNLSVLDTTDPDAISSRLNSLDLKKSFFIVSTKSGGTVETLSLFKFFYGKVAEAVGIEKAGEHFIAITDPGSGLADIAKQCNFRTIFLNDPNIGGRYSALSYFGLVPASLAGVDVKKLLDRAVTASVASESSVEPKDNPGLWLGTIIGELAKKGRNKLTIITSPKIASLGNWIEQLIAESTGKEGKGILPVVGEPLGKPEVYGDDRFFVYLRLDGENSRDDGIVALEKAGYPVVRMELHDIYDIGREFFVWELATAVAGYLIRINPFDQPNVESSKAITREIVSNYASKGTLPVEQPAIIVDGIKIYGNASSSAKSAGEALAMFLRQAKPKAYVALQAYLEPSSETDKVLEAIRTKIRDSTKLATTVGYGPRFLHSTGQLHKGDSGKGLFVQLTTSEPKQDLEIPDEPGSRSSSISFGVLKAAQVIGDRKALLNAGRQVICFDLGSSRDVASKLSKLVQASFQTELSPKAQN